MKTIAFALVATLFSSTTAFARPPKGFTCVNHMYRDSSLEISELSLEIKDSFVEGQDEVQSIVQGNLGLGDRFSVRSIALLVDSIDTDCESGSDLEFNCTGSSGGARIIVNGYISNENGLSGLASLTLLADLRDLKLNSKRHDEMLVATATADLEANGRPIRLKFATFFHRDATSGGSYCKEF